MEKQGQNWFVRTFSTGDIIAIIAGAIGMLSVFYNVQGMAQQNKENILDNEKSIVAVQSHSNTQVNELKQSVKDAEDRLREEMRAVESRQQQAIKNMNDETNRKLEQILDRIN